jgi:hypothetical protein
VSETPQQDENPETAFGDPNGTWNPANRTDEQRSWDRAVSAVMREGDRDELSWDEAVESRRLADRTNEQAADEQWNATPLSLTGDERNVLAGLVSAELTTVEEEWYEWDGEFVSESDGRSRGRDNGEYHRNLRRAYRKLTDHEWQTSLPPDVLLADL